MFQPLNISLVVRGPELDRALEASKKQAHHIPLKGWDACTGRSENIPGWEELLGIGELMENVKYISFHNRRASELPSDGGQMVQLQGTLGAEIT